MKKFVIGMCVLVMCTGMAMAQSAYEWGRQQGNNAALGKGDGNTCSTQYHQNNGKAKECNNGFVKGYNEIKK